MDGPMRRLKRMIYRGVCTFGAFVISAGFAKAQNETWLVILQQQLSIGVSCTYEHIVWVNAFELAGTEVIDGRVRCRDGREFYFTRPKPHLSYELRECEPAVC